LLLLEREEEQTVGAIEKFQVVIASNYQYAQEWKQANGGRVIGWLWHWQRKRNGFQAMLVNRGCLTRGVSLTIVCSHVLGLIKEVLS